MATVKLTNVKKVYGKDVVAVDNFNLEIEDKEFVVFVGPSGCGKSTTLRMIAGLEEITEGTIEIDGEVVNDLQPKDRHIAMVFQNYALYPHLSVFENMAFSLRLKKVPHDEIYKRVTEAAEILGITELLTRKPRALSGGQRQRVAIGRAMVRDSKVFLLDEPLSNLDAKLRASMRTELSKLHMRLQTTFIYVTHDQVEAMTLGTRIVVMKDGFIKQIDTPQNLYDYPANRFVASFIGTPQMNFYNGTIKLDGTVEFANGQVLKLSPKKMATLDEKRLEDGMQIILGIRPEDFAVAGGEGVTCRADVLEELGSECLLYGRLDLDNDRVIVEEDDRLALIAKIEARSEIKRGSVIHLAVDTERVHIFERSTHNSLLKKYSELYKK